MLSGDHRDLLGALLHRDHGVPGAPPGRSRRDTDMRLPARHGRSRRGKDLPRYGSAGEGIAADVQALSNVPQCERGRRGGVVGLTAFFVRSPRVFSFNPARPPLVCHRCGFQPVVGCCGRVQCVGSLSEPVGGSHVGGGVQPDSDLQPDVGGEREENLQSGPRRRCSNSSQPMAWHDTWDMANGIWHSFRNMALRLYGVTA